MYFFIERTLKLEIMKFLLQHSWFIFLFLFNAERDYKREPCYEVSTNNIGCSLLNVLKLPLKLLHSLISHIRMNRSIEKWKLLQMNTQWLWQKVSNYVFVVISLRDKHNREGNNCEQITSRRRNILTYMFCSLKRIMFILQIIAFMAIFFLQKSSSKHKSHFYLSSLHYYSKLKHN